MTSKSTPARKGGGLFLAREIVLCRMIRRAERLKIEDHPSRGGEA